MTPLEVSGGLHCKVTELESTEVIVNERGFVDPKLKLSKLHVYQSIETGNGRKHN